MEANHTIGKRVRTFRIAFAGLAVVFAVCIAIQVLFAGLAVFVDSANWARHTAFVHLIEFVPLVMLALCFAGKLPLRMRWQSFGLFFMILLMYFTANITTVMPMAAAFHPVLALGLFAVSIQLVPAAWRSWKSTP